MQIDIGGIRQWDAEALGVRNERQLAANEVRRAISRVGPIERYGDRAVVEVVQSSRPVVEAVTAPVVIGLPRGYRQDEYGAFGGFR